MEAGAPGYRWTWPEPIPAGESRALAAALGLARDVCELLIRRGYRDPEAAKAFLRPDPAALHAPELLPDMGAAVSRVEGAIRRGEGVLVHGDYDADGLCAAALLTRGFRDLGGRVEAFVPHRTRDGYDLGQAGLLRAREVGATLIVTADCGVSAVDAVASARAAGVDVVVTDHHRPPARLPDAVAVVDPSRGDAAYPFRGLAGVGVAFKLLAALFRRAGFPEGRLNQHLDLVALGTVADQAPLVDENRILVRMGLRALERTRKEGLRALLGGAGLRAGDGLTAHHLGYVVGPRLNAAGRVDSPADALAILLQDDPRQARELARRLDLHNRRRRVTDREVLEEAVAQLREVFVPERDRVVVLARDGWHPGVLGLAASRIAERVHRPTVLLSFEGELGRGSARSIEGFHLFRALEACAPLLERYGGHRMAAGLDIRRGRLEDFVSRLAGYAERTLSPEDLVRRLSLDLVVPLEAVTPELHDRLSRLAPFGSGNPTPVLAVEGVSFRSVARVGEDGRHLRATLSSEEGSVRAIGFGMGGRAEGLEEGFRGDVAFHLVEDRWRGRLRLSARLLDFRPAPG